MLTVVLLRVNIRGTTVSTKSMSQPEVEKLIALWAKIGIEYNLQGKLIVADSRKVQGAIARQTNNHGMIYHKKCSKFFATSNEVNINKIEPYLVLVEKRRDRDLWNYALTQWRVPISEGYGRRIRFLVFDNYNDKLIGLIGLCSPFFGGGLRDTLIGWTPDYKKDRLKNCMVAFVMGAVYPYNRQNFCSKLVAMLCQSVAVQQTFKRNYSTMTNKQPLAAIEAFAGFGESKIFLNTDWQYLGLTQGKKSTIHFNYPPIWELIKKNADPDIVSGHNIFLDKGAWKLRVITSALTNLGFSPKRLMNIKLQRGHYFLSLLENTTEYLCSLDTAPEIYSETTEEITSHWKNICF